MHVHIRGYGHGHKVFAARSVITSFLILAGYPESVGKGYRNFAAGQMVSMVIKLNDSSFFLKITYIIIEMLYRVFVWY